MAIERLNECFREGIAAHQSGAEVWSNPYHFATPENESWGEGWWHAQESPAP